jgi:proton-translocating NAD(P)+ transhydrogenase subunit beta
MSSWITLVIDLSIIALLVIGIAQFRTPRGARIGNGTAAVALLLAMAIVLYRNAVLEPLLLASGLAIGALVGAAIAARVTMIQIPAMVAFQHGAGGIAACAIAYVELTRGAAPVSPVAEASGFLGLAIGAATFSGSMLASGKLAGRLKQTPIVLPRHNVVLLALLAAIGGLGASAWTSSGTALALALSGVLIASVLIGVVFAIRIGGADMPVLISFLNATAGLAAAFCGLVIQNRLLIACGATVAASGSILTAVMCRAMNRSFVKVLAGGMHEVPAGSGETATNAADLAGEVAQARPERSHAELMQEATSVLRAAGRVVIIPGYGMALAGAQHQVASLAERLEALGKTVDFAVHPVAGRMPGHMHVLLAEASVDYGKLKDLVEVNGTFPTTDAALVVGACDVVNPAAIRIANTPISGMPILKAHEAKNVIVCNLDRRPGYSGVENPLYDEPTTLMLLGDASVTLAGLIESLPLNGETREAVA